MLSWVVKVIPQPPEPPPTKVEEPKEKAAPAPPPAPPPAPEKKVTFKDECAHEAPKVEKPKQEVESSEGSSPPSQAGVLTWISGALPQPAISPKLGRANSSSKEENTSGSKPQDEKGVMAWISQGLEKVVPQPDLKSKEPSSEEPPQVCQTAAAAAAAPQVTAVEVESDENKLLPPRMIDWIKQNIEKVVPQPETHPISKTDEAEKPKAEAAVAETDMLAKDTEQQHNVVGWIVSGIGRMLPQPVPKQDGDEVQTRGKAASAP